MKQRIKPLQFLRQNWLLVGILACIFVAGIYPKFGSKEGPLYTEYTVKYGAVFNIFLVSGLTLKTDNIFHTFRQYKLHLFIQTFTFIIIPIFTQVVVNFLFKFRINLWILKGLITVACMPPPVSSAVILTKAAQGNETAAIFNSILGSFLGIIITPILLLLNLGSTTVVPLIGTIIHLVTTVLMPLVVGQIIKNFTNFRIHLLPLSGISQSALIFVIYTTFCDTFLVTETGLSAVDVLFTVFSVLLLQIALMIIIFRVVTSKYLRRYFDAQDVIAVVFCSTHKSLTLGIPILRIMFHGYAHLSQISLPLLVYHPTQIILGGLVVPQIKDWMHSQKHKRPPV